MPPPFSAGGILRPRRPGQVSLDEAEHFPAQSRSERRYAPTMFGIVPKWRSASFRDRRSASPESHRGGCGRRRCAGDGARGKSAGGCGRAETPRRGYRRGSGRRNVRDGGAGRRCPTRRFRWRRRGEIAHFRIPPYVRLAEAFPTTLAGKIRKLRMREIEIRGAGFGEDGGEYGLSIRKRRSAPVGFPGVDGGVDSLPVGRCSI